MKKKYYGILLAAVIAAGTMGVTAQAAELADTEKLTETANVTDDVNTANSTDASVQAQSDELEVPLVLNQTYTEVSHRSDRNIISRLHRKKQDIIMLILISRKI